MKKTVKKPVRKATKLEDKVAEIEKKLLTISSFRLPENFVHLQRRVTFLENSQPNTVKEPETFEDCCKKHNQGWIVPMDGRAVELEPREVGSGLKCGVAVPSEKRAKQLAAIAKMMTVADALGHGSEGDSCVIIIDSYGKVGWVNDAKPQMISFKHMNDVLKAIRILGEETIRTAFGL